VFLIRKRAQKRPDRGESCCHFFYRKNAVKRGRKTLRFYGQKTSQNEKRGFLRKKVRFGVRLVSRAAHMRENVPAGTLRTSRAFCVLFPFFATFRIKRTCFFGGSCTGVFFACVFSGFPCAHPLASRRFPVFFSDDPQKTCGFACQQAPRCPPSQAFCGAFSSRRRGNPVFRGSL